MYIYYGFDLSFHLHRVFMILDAASLSKYFCAYILPYNYPETLRTEDNLKQGM